MSTPAIWVLIVFLSSPVAPADPKHGDPTRVFQFATETACLKKQKLAERMDFPIIAECQDATS